MNTGKYDLGVPVIETTYQKAVVTKEGKFQLKSFNVSGRKIPLLQIRRKTLEKEKEYLRMNTDDHYETLTEEEVDSQLKSFGEFHPCSLAEKKTHLKSIQRHRHWMIWHDHSSMANVQWFHAIPNSATL